MRNFKKFDENKSRLVGKFVGFFYLGHPPTLQLSISESKKQSEATCGSVHKRQQQNNCHALKALEHHIFQRFLLFLRLKDDVTVFALHFYPRGNILKKFSDKIFYRPTDRLIFSKWK